MIFDERTKFAARQTVTSTAISDVIDLGAAPTLRSVGSGEATYLVISVDEAVTAAGAATVAFSLESDSTSDLATSPTVHLTTGPIGKASLAAGATAAVIPLPAASNCERYLGVRFTVTTGPLTAGKFSALLTSTPPVRTVYPDAIN